MEDKVTSPTLVALLFSAASVPTVMLRITEPAIQNRPRPSRLDLFVKSARNSCSLLEVAAGICRPVVSPSFAPCQPLLTTTRPPSQNSRCPQRFAASFQVASAQGRLIAPFLSRHVPQKGWPTTMLADTNFLSLERNRREFRVFLFTPARAVQQNTPYALFYRSRI